MPNIILDNKIFWVELDKGIYDLLCAEKNIAPEWRDSLWKRFTALDKQKDSTDLIKAIHDELKNFRKEHPGFPRFSDGEINDFIKKLELDF